MLEKLQIRNYRHNRKLDIIFDKITTLRGASGKGKTSTISALKWIIFNNPAGTSFINWGSQEARVRLLVDARKIIRKRGKNSNIYKLDGNTYKAFGTTVPENISNLLNLSPLNFHSQHAGHFWFSETPGEVSRQLNMIVNLDLIDTTLSNLGKFQRESKFKIKDIKQRIKKAKEERKALKYIVAFDKKLKATEELAKKHATNAERLVELVNLVQLGKQYKEDLTKPIPNIKPLMNLHKNYRKKKREYQLLSALFGQAEEYEEVIYQLDIQIKAGEKKLKKFIGKGKVCPLCQEPVK